MREENSERGEQGKRRTRKKEGRERGEQEERRTRKEKRIGTLEDRTTAPVPVHLTTRPSLLRPRWKFVVWGHCRCRGTLAQTTPARKRENKRERERVV